MKNLGYFKGKIISRNIVATQWELYKNKVFPDPSRIDQIQIDETQKTFYAAFASGLRYIAMQMDDKTSDQEGANVVQSIFEEVNEFFQNKIISHKIL
jgi:hypothetical protein